MVVTCSSLMNLATEKLGYTTFFSLTSVVSLVGNFLIGLIVYKIPTVRKPINILIANMAMSDLLHPIFVFPVLLADINLDSWVIGDTFGKALCKLHAFLAHVSLAVSIQSLVLIAVDRFGAVVVPLHPPLISRKRCRFIILGTWILAMAVCSPLLYFMKFFQEGSLCGYFIDKTLTSYLLVVYIVFSYIPAFLLVILYSIIVIKLKKQVHPGEQSAIAEEQRARRNQKVLKMAIAIVVTFLFTWVPFLTNRLMVYYNDDSSIWSSCSFRLYYLVTFFLAMAYCAFNPIICFVFSSNYRKGFKRFVTCRAAVQG